MKRTITAIVFAALAVPALAQDDNENVDVANEEATYEETAGEETSYEEAVSEEMSYNEGAFVDFQVLKPGVALELAEAALVACSDAGYQVGVTVVDRFGLPQVFMRDRFAGPHVYETSRRKAWTAVSFRAATSDLAIETEAGEISSGIRHLTEALPLGGGLMVLEGSGSIVAGIGVSGSPSPDIDEECAAEGIAAIEDQIAF